MNVDARGEPQRLGFIGMGIMGTPMALNLVKAGHGVVVWNRTPGHVQPVVEAGAHAADSIEDLVRQVAVVFLMVSDDAAVDAVLARGSNDFAARVRGRIIVAMGAHSPSWAREIAGEIDTAAGAFVGAPVSGSREPAEQGRLLGLIGGADAAKSQVTPLLSAMCASVGDCGGPADGFTMKLAVNLFQTSLIAGLAEMMQFGSRLGLDEQLLGDLVANGPMGSEVVRGKLHKMLAQHFDADASVDNALLNLRLIAAESDRVGLALPVSRAATTGYQQLAADGLGAADFSAIGRRT